MRRNRSSRRSQSCRNAGRPGSIENRLLVETLEDRLLLSGNDPAQYDRAAPQWFQELPTQFVLPSTALSRPLQQPEVETPQSYWIARLTPAALAGIDTVGGAAALISHETPQVRVVRGLGLPGQILLAGTTADTAAIEAELRASQVIKYFQADGQVHGESLPDDQEFPSQLALNSIGQLAGAEDADIDAPEAWDITTGSSRVVVGVIDSGIDLTHPDLVPNLWINPGEIPASIKAALIDTDGDGIITFRDLNRAQNAGQVTDWNANGLIDGDDLLQDPLWADGMDTDGNCFPDDLFGLDFRNGGCIGGAPRDDNGHGTHVAGVIAAAGDNGIGIAGISWQSSIMVLKYLDKNRVGLARDAIRAINYATMMRDTFGTNVRVLNASWTTPDAEGLEESIQAAGRQDILFVAGAGNGNVLRQPIDSDAHPVYPASFDLDNIISVTGTNEFDTLVPSFNFGAVSVDLAAPSLEIASTIRGGGYGQNSGTSFAAPMVSGAAALAFANLPDDATADEVRAAILASVDPLPTLTGKVATGGRLNVFGTLVTDRYAPRASAIVSTANAGAASTHVTVTYRDNVGVRTGSIDSADLLVRREGDPTVVLTAELDGTPTVDAEGNLVVTYRVLAPGGAWDDADNGNYDILLRAGEVDDAAGNGARPMTIVAPGSMRLASLIVNIAPPGILEVNSFFDTVDINPGDGFSLDANGMSSLRAAIMEANALPGENTILLPAGTYTLTIPGQDEDAAATGDLDITDDLRIVGMGQGLTIINAAGLDRVFDVRSGQSAFSNLTITGGDVQGGCFEDPQTFADVCAWGGGTRVFMGAALRLADVEVTNNHRGGVYSLGSLVVDSTRLADNQDLAAVVARYPSLATVITDSIIENNLAGGISHDDSLSVARTSIAGNSGGSGIFTAALGFLSVDSSTIANNVTPESGGGIRFEGSGRATITNSTISGNRVDSAADGAWGGGIASIGNMALVNTTVVDNTAPQGAGIQFRGIDNETLTLRNSIVAQNDDSDFYTRNAVFDLSECLGCIVSLGNNFIGNIGEANGLINGQNGDQVGGPVTIDPLLGPLADNGGPTKTHAPLAGSPLIDAGGNSGAPGRDQRGVVRPVDGNVDGSPTVDIGAVEVNIGTISGTRYHDLNKNGLRDPGEPGLANRTIYLDLNENGTLDSDEPSTITKSDDLATPNVDETGMYSFPDIPPASYIVAEVEEDGWEQVPPRSIGYGAVQVQELDHGAALASGDFDGDGNSDIAAAHPYATIVPADTAPLTVQRTSTSADIQVLDIAGTLVDVNVTIEFAAGGEFDETGVTLVSPQGTRIELVPAGTRVLTGINAVLDDDAQDPLPTNTAVVGTFRPSQSLGLLVDEDPNGDWKLETDGVAALVQWGLDLTTSAVTASPQITLTNVPSVVKDLDVELVVDGPLDASADLFLKNSSGTRIKLVSVANFSASGLLLSVGAVFDDDSPNPLPPAPITPPLFGTYRPAESLGAFVAQDPNQTWTLEIEINGELTVFDEVNRLVSWSLHVKTFAEPIDIAANDGNSQFAPLTSVVPDGPTRAIIARDVDGDLDVDLIVAVSDGDAINHVSVFLNAGNGTFDAPINVDAGFSLVAMASADLNNDGKPDLVVANASGLQILLNEGGGNFSQGTLFGVTTPPLDVQIGDFNGDNLLDIAASDGSDGGGRVTVLFDETRREITLSGELRNIAAVDWDGDGDKDIVAEHRNAGVSELVLLANDGQGDFATSILLNAGNDLSAFAAADVDDDGAPDVVLVNSVAKTITVWLNNRAGSLVQSLVTPVMANIESLQFAQLDADNRPDFILAGSLADLTQTLLSSGDPSVVQPTTNSYRVAVGGAEVIANVDFADFTKVGKIRGRVINDLNGDKKQDFRELGVPDWHVYLDLDNSGDLNVGDRETITNSDGDYGFDNVEVRDYVVRQVFEQGWDPISALSIDVTVGPGEIVGNQNFAIQGTDGAGGIGTGLNAKITGKVFRDANGNQKQDPGELGIPGQRVWLDRNRDGMSPESEIQVTSADDPSTTDVDEAGNYKFKNLGPGSYSVALLNNAPDMKQTFPVENTFTSNDSTAGPGAQSVAAADFDSDGLVDLASANSDDGKVSVFLQSGGSFPTTGTSYRVDDTPQSHGPVVVISGKVNSDNSPDLITANFNTASVSVLLNDGQGRFNNANVVASGLGYAVTSVAAGDFDFDDDHNLDLAVTVRALSATATGVVKILRGNGAGQFSEIATIPVGISPYSITTGQFNDDNHDSVINSLDLPDLALANFGDGNGDGTAMILMNNHSRTFQNNSQWFVNTSEITTALGSYFLTVGEFNGVFGDDVAVANYPASNVSILLNDGQGSFVQSALVTTTTPTALAAVDLDGDGDVDLAATNYIAPGELTAKLSVLRNDGQGTFTAPLGASFGIADLSESSDFGIAAGDFNNDQLPDLAVAKGNVGQVRILTDTVLVAPHDVRVTTDQVVGDIDFGAEIASGAIDLRIVSTPTAVDSNAEAALLPQSRAYVHERLPFWAELWVSTPESANFGVNTAIANLAYVNSKNYFTATDIQFSAAFEDDGNSSIDDALGTVQVAGRVKTTELVGGDKYVLLARVRFEPTSSDSDIPLDPESNHLATRVSGPWLEFSGSIQSSVSIKDVGAVATAMGSTPDTELWPFLMDLNDSSPNNHPVDFGDFSIFASHFFVSDFTAHPEARIADFNLSGRVDFGDFSLFASNFLKSDNLVLPANFPQAWNAASGSLAAPQTLALSQIDLPTSGSLSTALAASQPSEAPSPIAAPNAANESNKASSTYSSLGTPQSIPALLPLGYIPGYAALASPAPYNSSRPITSATEPANRSATSIATAIGAAPQRAPLDALVSGRRAYIDLDESVLNSDTVDRIYASHDFVESLRSVSTSTSSRSSRRRT